MCCHLSIAYIIPCFYLLCIPCYCFDIIALVANFNFVQHRHRQVLTEVLPPRPCIVVFAGDDIEPLWITQLFWV